MFTPPSPTASGRKATLALLRFVASEATGRSHELDALKDAIKRGEREHRAFGRRLVGNIGPRLTIGQVVDLFACRVLGEGVVTYHGGNDPIARLSGLREDYVRGAILASHDAFREDFLARLQKAYPEDDPTTILRRAMAADYAALLQGQGPTKIAIVNPSDRDRAHRYLFSFGAYGWTRCLVWADTLDAALDEAVDWLAEHAPGLLCDDEVAEEYRRLVQDEGIDPDVASEQSAVDTTCAGNGGHYLHSWEWGVTDDPSRWLLLHVLGRPVPGCVCGRCAS